MSKHVLTATCLLLLVANSALAEPNDANVTANSLPLRGDAILYRKLAIPRSFLVERKGRRFGGDLRIGDLNGDSRCDFLVYRCDHGAPSGAHMGGIKPVFLGVFDMAGQPLWQAGKGGDQPSRPMSVAIKDWTGDGADDVICFWRQPQPGTNADWRSLTDVSVQLRDGRSGQVLRETAPPEIRRRRMKDPVGANWIHQRLLIANFRGTAEPRDLVVKLGDTYVALDERLEPLWTFHSEWTKYSQCPAYIPAVGDIDDDGRDELLTGYHLLDDDGSLLWKNKLGANMDSVVIGRWQGQMRAICSGLGHVLNAEGEIILSLGEQLAPHGQEVRIADFDSQRPGNELALRAYGHKPTIHVVASDTNRILRTLAMQASPTNVGMEPIRWRGKDRPSLLFNGGCLWDLERGQGWRLPDLPPPNGGDVHRMGFYHMIPANLVGDAREEMVVWDPTAAHVYIYTQRSADQSALPKYVHGPRQYNPRLMD